MGSDHHLDQESPQSCCCAWPLDQKEEHGMLQDLEGESELGAIDAVPVALGVHL